MKQPKLQTFPVLHVSSFGEIGEDGRHHIASSVLVNIGRKLNVHKTFNLRLASGEETEGATLGECYTWRMQKVRIFAMFLLPLRNH